MHNQTPVLEKPIRKPESTNTTKQNGVVNLVSDKSAFQAHQQFKPSKRLKALNRWLLCFNQNASFYTTITQAALLAALCLWTFKMVCSPLIQGGNTFLHFINLPIHETGHIIFTPFGRFMHFLGGTLFQITLPLIIMMAFLIQKKDAFAASIMLWWSGQNFLDIAPYINDARTRSLPLVGGGQHDWAYLLGQIHALAQDHSLAQLSFDLGSIIMFIAITWGLTILWMQWDWIATRKKHTKA